MDRPLNATAASLLGFLHNGPMAGWDLAATAQTAIGSFWSLTRSQVYRELGAMADAGLVTAQRSGPRDRRPYALTDAGRAAFAAWINREPGAENIRFPLLLTIEFGRHLPPGRLAAFVHAHRADHAHRLAHYEALEKSARAAPADQADPYPLATVRFGIAYERAALDWFEALPDQIRGGGPWKEAGSVQNESTAPTAARRPRRGTRRAARRR